MRKAEILILMLVCAAMTMTAQQLYPDTFKLAEQQTTVNMDEVLLDMVAAQSAELHFAENLPVEIDGFTTGSN